MADFILEYLFQNFLYDKLQINFLKCISKINKKSANLAVLSEFGRYYKHMQLFAETTYY